MPTAMVPSNKKISKPRLRHLQWCALALLFTYLYFAPTKPILPVLAPGVALVSDASPSSKPEATRIRGDDNLENTGKEPPVVADGGENLASRQPIKLRRDFSTPADLAACKSVVVLVYDKSLEQLHEHGSKAYVSWTVAYNYFLSLKADTCFAYLETRGDLNFDTELYDRQRHKHNSTRTRRVRKVPKNKIPLHPVWARIVALRKAMVLYPGAQHFLYTDMDAIMQAPVPLGALYDALVQPTPTSPKDTPALIVNKPTLFWECDIQCNQSGITSGCINTGALLFKRGLAATDILREWWLSALDGPEDNFHRKLGDKLSMFGGSDAKGKESWTLQQYSEQNRMMYLYNTNAMVEKYTLVLPRGDNPCNTQAIRQIETVTNEPTLQMVDAYRRQFNYRENSNALKDVLAIAPLHFISHMTKLKAVAEGLFAQYTMTHVLQCDVFDEKDRARCLQLQAMDWSNADAPPVPLKEAFDFVMPTIVKRMWHHVFTASDQGLLYFDEGEHPTSYRSKEFG